MQERVERESMRLDALVGDPLTLARLEADAAQAAHERIDVVELLAEVCDDARFEARAAQRDLVFTTNGGYSPRSEVSCPAARSRTSCATR
jgi:two-component system, OmpR family, sensor kinase